MQHRASVHRRPAHRRTPWMARRLPHRARIRPLHLAALAVLRRSSLREVTKRRDWSKRPANLARRGARTARHVKAAAPTSSARTLTHRRQPVSAVRLIAARVSGIPAARLGAIGDLRRALVAEAFLEKLEPGREELPRFGELGAAVNAAKVLSTGRCQGHTPRKLAFRVGGHDLAAGLPRAVGEDVASGEVRADAAVRHRRPTSTRCRPGSSFPCW